MTSTIAVIGKSGSGKTTVVKTLYEVIKEQFKDKTILLIDNDLTEELAGRFGLRISNTIYGIRSGKHEYNTGIPKKMTKQEYIEWALEDILTEVDENTDIIVSHLVASKDCICPITRQMMEAVSKLIDRYDFVIFDCEYDLKYLVQLVDYPIDTTLLVTKGDLASLHLASIIYESNKKYAAEGQFGVILNQLKKGCETKDIENANSFSLNTLGVIKEYDDKIDEENIKEILKNLYSRLNLPQNVEY